MARRHAIGVQILCGFKQILELHPFVATDAGHRRRTCQITVGKLVDHRIAKDVFVIQHVMGETHVLGHAAGVMNVDARTTGTFLGKGRAVIVKLKRHPNHVIALARQFRGDDRAVDTARHGHHHAGFAFGLCKAQGVQPGCTIERHGFTDFRGSRGI